MKRKDHYWAYRNNFTADFAFQQGCLKEHRVVNKINTGKNGTIQI